MCRTYLLKIINQSVNLNTLRNKLSELCAVCGKYYISVSISIIIARKIVKTCLLRYTFTFLLILEPFLFLIRKAHACKATKM